MWLVHVDQQAFGHDAWSEELWVSALAQTWVWPEVGYAVLRPAGDVIDLDRLVVVPEGRGRGAGLRLLGEVLAEASPGAAVMLEVSSDNRPALAVYARAGFVEIDRRPGYYRDGSDAVIMRRDGGAESRPEPQPGQAGECSP